MKIRAKTYPDDDRELPEKEVEGELKRNRVESLDYTQYLVGGVPVQPDTVQEITDDSRDQED